MDWMLTGLMLGFAGSVHCVGMCGVFLSPDLREVLFTPGPCRFLPLVEPV